MKGKIAVGPGDGIGPEITAEGVKVLEAISKKYGHDFELTYIDLGGVAIDKYGTSLPEQSLKVCRESDAILFGAAGGPKWDHPGAKEYANACVLLIRKEFELFANLRPVKVYPNMVDCSPVKPDIVRDVDLIVLRENCGGAYFGEPKKRWLSAEGERMAVDSMLYSEHEVKRVIRVGFELARTRRKKLCSVDKANVLQSSRLWHEIADELAPQYPDIELEHAYTDACAMWLLRRPKDFDVIVTSNLFGDILSDEASILAGSLGMLPSAQIAGSGVKGTTFGFFESSHGSAPKHAGKNVVNPIATILSVAMMLQYAFGLIVETKCIEKAVEKVIEKHRTYDIMEEGKIKVGTKEMGDLIAEAIAVA